MVLEWELQEKKKKKKKKDYFMCLYDLLEADRSVGVFVLKKRKKNSDGYREKQKMK